MCVLSKQTAAMCHTVPILRVEEWPLPGDSLTGDTVRALIDRVSGSVASGLTPPMLGLRFLYWAFLSGR